MIGFNFLFRARDPNIFTATNRYYWKDTRHDYILYIDFYIIQGPSWSWSYGSSIYNYLCNQCLSPLTLWVRILFRRSVLDTTLCVCQWLAAGRWFSLGTPTTDRHDITEILFKVPLNTNSNIITPISPIWQTLSA